MTSTKRRIIAAFAASIATTACEQSRAQFLTAVTPTGSSHASIQATEVLYPNSGGSPFNVSIPYQSNSSTGLNQTLTIGTTTTDYTTVSNSYTSTPTSLSLQVTATTGFATNTVINPTYNASGYVVPTTNNAGGTTVQVSFQVPLPELVQISGLGTETPSTSQELQTWSTSAAFSTGFSTYSAFGGNWGSGPDLDLVLSPNITYTLSASAGIGTSLAFTTVYNPNGDGTNINLQVLSVVPEPASIALIAIPSLMSLSRRRR